MKAIFVEVTRSANVLDQTFSEQFGREVSQTAGDREPRAAPREVPRPRHDTPPAPPNAAEQFPRQRRQPATSSSAPPPAPRPTPAGSLTSDVPRCVQHGLPCAEREVNRDGPNKGRIFYACQLPQSERCDFFAWASDVNPSHGVKCPGHDELCVERTVRREGPNKGREFFACRRSQADSCGYFQWKDELQTQPPGASTASRGFTDTAPKCSGHDAPCALRTTRKAGPNQNREFYTCSFQGADSCGYFEWKDEMEAQQRPRSAPSRASPAAEGTNETPTCGCGLPGVLLTCRNGANAGRKFYKCPNPQGSQCEFFQWGS